jgi:hypothetical protein
MKQNINRLVFYIYKKGLIAMNSICASSWKSKRLPS